MVNSINTVPSFCQNTDNIPMLCVWKQHCEREPNITFKSIWKFTSYKKKNNKRTSLHFNLCPQQKRKLRLYISNTFNPAKPDSEDSEGSIASWELRVEGKLLDDVSEHLL